VNTPPGMRPRGRTENRGAAFEQFVLRILDHDPEIELAAGRSYGSHRFDVAARRYGKPLLVDSKQATLQTAWRIKQLGDQLKSAAARYSKPDQEALSDLALACAGVLSEPIRDRAARSGLHLWDPWIQAKKGLAGRIPAAVRTRQPCAADPRWARRVANAVLILRVLMLQCRNVTGESLERSGSFLA